MQIINNGNNASSSGVTFAQLLALLLIGLRLVGCIDWPWWLVLAPLWVPLAVAIVAVAAVALWQWLH